MESLRLSLVARGVEGFFTSTQEPGMIGAGRARRRALGELGVETLGLHVWKNAVDDTGGGLIRARRGSR